MASSSGTYKDGINKQAHNSVSSSYNGGSVHGGEWGVPTFQHQQTISMDWTPEEQALLEEGLAKYAMESNIIRYAKIAVQLKNKTVRDVALRCRWMTKKEISKRRKEDFNARKNKDRKEKFIEATAKPSRLSIQSGLSQAQGMVSNCNDDNNISYNDITGATRQLLQQNAWAFKQISANLSTHHVHENLGLLSQARDNIFKIITNNYHRIFFRDEDTVHEEADEDYDYKNITLNDMGPTMKRMPQLPKLNEELANSVLPPTSYHPIQLQ